MTVKSNINSISSKLDSIESRAGSLKLQSSNFVSIINAGSGLDAGRILSYGNSLSSYVSQIYTILGDADLSAIQDEARDRYNDGVYDLSTNLNNLKTAILSCAAYIDSTVPKDPTNTYYLTTVAGSNGSSTNREFSAAQLSGFVSELNAILAQID
jgi:hypothetical protein